MSGPTLYLLCGKIAAGKSTLAASLAERRDALLISEDAWLGALYMEEMKTPRDFLHRSGLLRAVMGPHVSALLRAGNSVVLDFHANTVEARTWIKGILSQTEAGHELHLLDPPDAVCLARLHARNTAGGHPFSATEAQFHAISRHFAPPTPEEGFTVVRHDTAEG